MKAKEAIETLKSAIVHGYVLGEAVNIAIDALDKQIPKLPIVVGKNIPYCVCPNCNCRVNTNYCPDCGQCLNWEV